MKQLPEALLKGNRGVFIVEGDLAIRTTIKEWYEEYIIGKIKGLKIPNDNKKVLFFTSISFCNDYVNMNTDDLNNYIDSIKEAIVLWVVVGMERDTMATRMLFDIIFERKANNFITILSVTSFRSWLESLTFIDKSIRGELVKQSIIL